MNRRPNLLISNSKNFYVNLLQHFWNYGDTLFILFCSITSPSKLFGDTLPPSFWTRCYSLSKCPRIASRFTLGPHFSLVMQDLACHLCCDIVNRPMAEGMQHSLKMCACVWLRTAWLPFLQGAGVGGVAYLHGLTFLTFRMQKLHCGLDLLRFKGQAPKFQTSSFPRRRESITRELGFEQ